MTIASAITALIAKLTQPKPAPWRRGDYCDLCNNTGQVNCYCGGDLCVCENYGEHDCPRCGGGSADGAVFDDGIDDA